MVCNIYLTLIKDFVVCWKIKKKSFVLLTTSIVNSAVTLHCYVPPHLLLPSWVIQDLDANLASPTCIQDSNYFLFCL